MRKLGLLDAFALARIIKAANLKEVITDFGMEVINKQNNGEDVDIYKVGFEFFVTVISAASDERIEKKFYELYADIKGAQPDEVKYYDFTTVKEDIKAIIELNNLKVFFDWLSASLTKQQ